jgi:ABC-2 type transport system permease protein
VLSLLAMSFIRVMLGILPAALLAIPLYHYSIFTLGLPLIAFFTLLLVMGWAVGLAIIALILRHGLGAENLAWVAIFVLSPISGIYYPISVLPVWLQWIAWCFPTAYVFEGMRAVLFQNVVRLDYLVAALGLDAVYLAIGSLILLWSFRRARRTGALLQMGE